MNLKTQNSNPRLNFRRNPCYCNNAMGRDKLSHIEWNKNLSENLLSQRKNDELVRLKKMFEIKQEIYAEYRDKGRLYPTGNPVFRRKTARYQVIFKQ